jgi:MoxR-like ATPase
MSTDTIGKQLEQFRKDYDAMRREIGKVVVGQRHVVDGLLTAVVTGGHVLLEGVPGVGKTLLVRTLADVVQLTFQRIQFTPDLMPADLLGTYVVMETPEGRRTFEFQKGPIFSHIILADQINRGTPKTQSAMLEAMEGQEITVANETFHLPQPFFVMATQNPLEMEGTFPLPEPEIDRFFVKLLVERPTPQEVEQILERTTEGEEPICARVVDGPRLREMRDIARRIAISDDMRRKAVMLTMATHPDNAGAPHTVQQYVQYGASTRGAQALVLAAKVHAIMAGRGEVTGDDLKAVALPCLRHRLVLNFEGQAENMHHDVVIEAVVGAVFGAEEEYQEEEIQIDL